jgi:histidyl-tRNA synthetase
VNSIGDEACRPAYREELVAFLRANADRLRDEHRNRFEDNPLRVLDCKDEACRAVAMEAPRIVDRLCEPCREHFEAVPRVSARRLEAVVTPTLVGVSTTTRGPRSSSSAPCSQAWPRCSAGATTPGRGAD